MPVVYSRVSLPLQSLEHHKKKGLFPRLTAYSCNPSHLKNWSHAPRPVVQHVERQGETRKKADCFPLLIKMCEFRSQLGQHSPNWVPSNGSMAPCRSHHGNHTRQEIDPSSDRLGTESHQCKAKQERVLPKKMTYVLFIYIYRITLVFDSIKQQR